MSYRDEARNFFYDITISTPDFKKKARLTYTLLKQCIKADIIEAIASEDSGEGASSLTLTFTEADFLPDSLNKTPAEGVAGRGYTTNRSGALLDIRFDSEKGFTYVSQQELQSGTTDSSRTVSGQSEPVVFMFSNNNIVDITWGHLEPRTSRSRRFKIGTVNYSTGASGSNLTLQCYTLQKDLQRLKLTEGKVWLDNEDNPQSLKECLHAVARVFGARLEFDEEEVTNKSMENYVRPTKYELNRTAPGGDTLVSSNSTPLYLVRSQFIDDWLKQLAKDYNSVYEIYEDPIINIPVIRFTSKNLRFKKVIKTLNYRDPKGIMLEFQYNTIAGELSKEAASSAISEEGKSESLYIEPQLTDGKVKTEAIKTFDPVTDQYDRNSREIIQRGLVGESVTAASTSVSSVQKTANVDNYERSFMGFVTVKTIGHPDLQPDVMNIQGVGVRASTTYRFFQVQHSLSSSGYFCTMQGKTQESVEEGTNNSDKLKENSEYLRPQLTTGNQ